MRAITRASVAVLVFVRVVFADEPAELQTSPLAQAFGSAPVMWGMQLSPDGTKISGIQAHPTGVMVLRVVDLVDGSADVLLSTMRGDFDLTWCDWANDTRLLCGLRMLIRANVYSPVTRLVAVNTDGSGMKMLLERRLEDTFTQFQDRVIDWLPEEPEHVLVQVPSSDGSGVGRLNIYNGGITNEARIRGNVFQWISDGHGSPRLHKSVTADQERWFVRDSPDSPWRRCSRSIWRTTVRNASSIRIPRSMSQPRIRSANISAWSRPPTWTTVRACISSTSESRRCTRPSAYRSRTRV